MRRVIVLSIIFLILLTGLFVAQPVVLHGARVITPAAAPALTGQISQTLASNTADAKPLPQPGKDYDLKQTLYFDNHSWAFVTIQALNGSAISGAAILQNKQGMFQVVLGPGTAFPDVAVRNLPSDLKSYLNQQGYIYGSVSQ